MSSTDLPQPRDAFCVRQATESVDDDSTNTVNALA
jgi:hypothetical protein